MRDYPVPFSTREEAPFIFNLTLRELMWIGGGFLVGFVAAIFLFVITGMHLKNVFFCFLVVLPTTAAGFYFGKKRFEMGDNILATDKYLLLKFKYRYRPHKYYNRRN